MLVKRLGRQRAEDAFQETFLRALRAYRALRHGEHLRAWVLTIARNVAVDSFRREKPTVELEEPVELPAPARLRRARAPDRRAAAHRARGRRPPLRLRPSLRRDRRRARLVRGRGPPGRLRRRPPQIRKRRSTHDDPHRSRLAGSARPPSAKASSTSPTTSPTRRSATCSSPSPTAGSAASPTGPTPRSTSSPPTSARACCAPEAARPRPPRAGRVLRGHAAASSTSRPTSPPCRRSTSRCCTSSRASRSAR